MRNLAVLGKREAPAIEILNPLQVRILTAKSPKPPKVLTVRWAVEA
jgi:hypothetical protein